jgi:G3E family GTPase
MGLETSLMKDSNGDDIEDFYEMPNGCICCAAKDDLIQTLDSLLEKSERLGKPKLEFILVETNGLADPCQVVQTFWLDDYLCSKVQLHSCVTLIDCKEFANKLKSTISHETE